MKVHYKLNISQSEILTNRALSLFPIIVDFPKGNEGGGYSSPMKNRNGYGTMYYQENWGRS